MSKPIFSIEIEDQNPVHNRIKVFNRGGYSGTLVVNTSDASDLISRLTGDTVEKTMELIKEAARPQYLSEFD